MQCLKSPATFDGFEILNLGIARSARLFRGAVTKKNWMGSFGSEILWSYD